MERVKNLLEAFVLWLAFSFFRMMPPETASATGGWIGRTIGPRLAASRKALKNIKNAFPDLPDSDCQKIVLDMWDNLGRVIAEYPHLKEIALTRTEIINESLLDSIRNDSSVLITGHLANWEIFAFLFNHRLDMPVSCVYREPNNPYAARLLERCRLLKETGRYIPKSKSGTRDLVETLKDGGRVGILIDQKYNQGIPVNFFGRPAMTSAAFSKLAEKFDCPILPVQTQRLNGCRFRITIHPPFKTNGRSDEDVILQAHRMLESWIRERPGLWLWLHRRWDSKVLQEKIT